MPPTLANTSLPMPQIADLLDIGGESTRPGAQPVSVQQEMERVMPVIEGLRGAPVPIFIADYVLLAYGTGAIQGVPAHDSRDFDFALKYGLPILPVIDRTDGLTKSFVLGKTMRPGLADALRHQAEYPAFAAWRRSDELHEGTRAFAEKRRPDYAALRQQAAEDGGPEYFWGSPRPGACPRCGARNLPAGFKFCGNCGNAMPTGATCPKCSTAVAPGAKFCGNCGTKL